MPLCISTLRKIQLLSFISNDTITNYIFCVCDKTFNWERIPPLSGFLQWTRPWLPTAKGHVTLRAHDQKRNNFVLRLCGGGKGLNNQAGLTFGRAWELTETKTSHGLYQSWMGTHKKSVRRTVNRYLCPTGDERQEMGGLRRGRWDSRERIWGI